MRQTSDNAIDYILEQPGIKQDLVQRKRFIGDQQENLEDVLTTIGNFFQFSHTMVSFDVSNIEYYPLILLCVSETLSLRIYPGSH